MVGSRKVIAIVLTFLLSTFVPLSDLFADSAPRLVYQFSISGMVGISTAEPVFDDAGRITSVVTSGSPGNAVGNGSNPYLYLIDTIGTKVDSLICSRGDVSYFCDFQFAPVVDPGVKARVFVSYVRLADSLEMIIDECTFGTHDGVRRMYKTSPFDIVPGWTFDRRFGHGDRDDITLSPNRNLCNAQRLVRAKMDVTAFSQILHFYDEYRAFRTIDVSALNSLAVDTSSAVAVLVGDLLGVAGCDTLNIVSRWYYSDHNDSVGVTGDYSTSTHITTSAGSASTGPASLQLDAGLFIERALSGDFDTQTSGDEVLLMGSNFAINAYKSGSPFAALYSFRSGTANQLWSKEITGEKWLKDARSEFIAVLRSFSTVYSIRPDFAGVSQEMTIPVPLYYADIVQAPSGNSPLYLVGTHDSTIYVYDLSVVTDADEEAASALPSGVSLSQNYPNPFNPSTTISYELPVSSDVTVTIANILGQTVRQLHGGMVAAGTHTIDWDGRDDAGARVSSGLYYYVLQAGEMRLSKKMLLVK